jgi:hypothetical protein
MPAVAFFRSKRAVGRRAALRNESTGSVAVKMLARKIDGPVESQNPGGGITQKQSVAKL